MSIVQLSRFLSFFSCDSFDILSNPFRFVKNFFIFLFCLICFPFGPLQATACIGYHINKALSTVFSCPRLFRLRVSGWPDLVRLFKAPSSATGAILSLQNGIVNVFSVFYLFQTIRTIQYFLTILKVQNMTLPIIVFIHTLNACRTEKNTAGSSPKRSICYNRN